MMIRQTVIPTENAYLLAIPDEWVGKRVTIVYDKEWLEQEPAPVQVQKKQKPSDLFADCRVDLSTFVFNRDEANDYE